MIRMEHAALYVRDLERAKAFFTDWFQASAGPKYHNPRTGFQSYFLTFGEGARLEIMTKPELRDAAKEPERTGYATQKPLKLLERLLLPVTRPGDLVVDLCCGSGTALEAAQKIGCRFAGMDVNPEAIAITLARLKPENLTVICPCGKEKAELLAEEDPKSGRFLMKGLAEENAGFPAKATPADNLESWDIGRIENGVFRAEKSFRRSFRYPELTMSLRAEPGKIRAVMTTDAAGIRRAYKR